MMRERWKQIAQKENKNERRRKNKEKKQKTKNIIVKGRNQTFTLCREVRILVDTTREGVRETDGDKVKWIDIDSKRKKTVKRDGNGAK